MKPNKLTAIQGNDWCHRCGERRNMTFVTFSIPENAEHSIHDAKGGMFRICQMCVADFTRAVADPESHSSYEPWSVDRNSYPA
jgi:hypothetical protein